MLYYYRVLTMSCFCYLAIILRNCNPLLMGTSQGAHLPVLRAGGGRGLWHLLLHQPVCPFSFFLSLSFMLLILTTLPAPLLSSLFLSLFLSFSLSFSHTHTHSLSLSLSLVRDAVMSYSVSCWHSPDRSAAVMGQALAHALMSMHDMLEAAHPHSSAKL